MSVLDGAASALAGAGFAVAAFGSEEERAIARGRVTVFEPPRPDRVYTLGFDSAMGIDGRDLTTACVMDKSAQREGEGRARQVCEAAGAWGPERADRIVYALCRYYNGCFVMGERQGGGLAVLRKVYDDPPRGYGHKWLWYDRPLGAAVPVMGPNPVLGWNTTANDLTMTRLMEAVRNREVEFRSAPLLDQMRRLRWRPRGRDAERDERVGDDKLQMRLEGGGSPDLVVAARLAVYALAEVAHFAPPRRPAFAPGTYGAIFKLEERLPGLFRPEPGGACRFLKGSR